LTQELKTARRIAPLLSWGTAAAILLIGGCSRTPSARDAHALLKALDLATRVEGDEARVRLLLQACGEINSCAHGCARELQAAAQPSVDASERGAILSSCFDELRQAQLQSRMTPDVWFHGYLARYAERAAPALEMPERHQLEAARARLQFIHR
jgi:hypothetical protein